MKSRLEWKVGLFVLIGLVLVAALLIEFSKGVTFFRSTYDIYLRAPNVGGVKPGAAVDISGVQVGTVSAIQLAPSGTNVTLTLRIFSDYVIHQDALFMIEQAGFLGDQYVAVVPTKNEAPPFKNGGVAYAQAPFNLQEFTRSASGFISRVDDTIKKLNDALDDVTGILLNPQTLTNLSVTAANLRTVSERALGTFETLDRTIATNTPGLDIAVSNLVFFSRELNGFAVDARSLLSTNREDLTRTVRNVESSSESLKTVMQDLQAGKGLAGNLLRNERMAAQTAEIVNNLSITTSNLNRLGLWHMLWRHEPRKAKTSRPPEPLESPKAQD